MTDWLKAYIETTAEGLDNVCAMLYSCGLNGLMLDDAEEFKRFSENPDGEWDYIGGELLDEKLSLPYGVTFYVTDNAAGMDTLSLVKNGISRLTAEDGTDYGKLGLSLKNVKEEDWANNWRKYFKPFPIGRKIMLRPSWEPIDGRGDGRTVLSIDPGHIFGTGTHETTRLCIELLEDCISGGESILDAGCGSGILSIAALLLGASHSDAVDIDPNAVPIACENAEINGIGRDRFNAFAGNVLEDEEIAGYLYKNKYEVIVANIVADAIIGLCPVAAKCIKNDGTFIASGIIHARTDDVKEAMSANGFDVINEKTEGEWAAIAARRRSAEE